MKKTALLYKFNETQVIIHTSPALDVTLEVGLCLILTGLMPAIVALSLYFGGSL